MGRISSNSVAAQAAISELTGIDVSQSQNKNIQFGYSHGISGMNAGREVANKMLDSVSSLVDSTLQQANKFPKLAHVIEERDVTDAQGWGGN